MGGEGSGKREGRKEGIYGRTRNENARKK